MKTGRLLVGTLVIVLIVGLVTPAFAADDISNKPEGAVSSGSIDPVAPLLADPADVVFENGDPVPDGIGYFIDNNLPLDNFELVEATAITDVHFIIALDGDPTPFDGPFEYFIFGDAGGVPDGGNLIASGTGINVETEALDPGLLLPIPRFAIWFDFEEPVPLESGTTYWIGVHAGDTFDFLPQRPVWEFSTDGDGLVVALSGDLGDLVPASPGSWFQITAKGVVVGGEMLPVDTTSLLVAGAQANAAWMIPAIVSAIGIGIVLARKF